MPHVDPFPDPEDGSAHAVPTGDRGSVGLLRDPVFGPYFASTVAAATGVWVYNIVAAVVVFDLTGSALQVGLVSVAQFLPQVVLAPWAGARADRGDRARQLMWGRLTSAAGGCGLAAWLAAVGDSAIGGSTPVVAASLVVGVGFAVTGPAVMAIMPALVRPSELGTAMALTQAPYTVARTIGPAIGSTLLVMSGPVLAFVVAGLANASHGLVAARARLRPQPRDATGDGSVRTGLRHLRADPVCAWLLVAVTTVGLALDPPITLMPALAAHLGGGEALVGWLVAAFGAGSTGVIAVLGPLRRAVPLVRVGRWGLGLFAAGYGVVALGPPTGVALGAVFGAGVGMMLGITALSTMLQQRLPEGLRGRIMALWSVAYLGSRPVAATVNGAVADHVSVGAAFGVMALTLIAGMLVVAPARVTAPPPGPGGSTP